MRIEMKNRIFDKGSISLFLAIFISGAVVLFYLLNMLVEYRLFQTAIQLACSNQAEQILASYDRPLLERYGLFAYESDNLNSSVFDESISVLRRKNNANITVTEQASLFSNKELMDQIRMFMRPRFPVYAAGNIWNRIKGLLPGKEESKLPALPEDINGKLFYSREGQDELRRAFSFDDNLKGYYSDKYLAPIHLYKSEIPRLKDVISMSTEIDKAGYNELSSIYEKHKYGKEQYSLVNLKDSSLDFLKYLEKSKEFYERRAEINDLVIDEGDENGVENSDSDKKEKGFLKGKLTELNSKIQDMILLEDENKLLADGLIDIDISSVETVTRAASEIFDRLNTIEIPIYDSLCLNEYIINQCSSAVRNGGNSLKDTSLNTNITLRGNAFSSLNFKSNVEIEEIITGLDGKAAERLSKLYIFLIRFLIQGLDIRSNKFRMSTFTFIANTVALLASLVGVPISPESVVATLVFINAVGGALRDLVTLSSGKVIKLFSSKDFYIDYIDHLRLFLLVIPDDIKLTRLAEKIKSNTKDSFYTAVGIRASWESSLGKRSLGFDSRYRFNLAEVLSND